MLNLICTLAWIGLIGLAIKGAILTGMWSLVAFVLMLFFAPYMFLVIGIMTTII